MMFHPPQTMAAGMDLSLRRQEFRDERRRCSGKKKLGKYDKDKFLGGGFKYFLFSPLPGEMIQFD